MIKFGNYKIILSHILENMIDFRSIITYFSLQKNDAFRLKSLPLGTLDLGFVRDVIDDIRFFRGRG